MQLKTVLNRVHPVKGFVYEKAHMVPDAAQPNEVRLDVRVRARRGSRGICSACGRRGPPHGTGPADSLPFRRVGKQQSGFFVVRLARNARHYE